jgi:hypothetical protein
MLPVHQWPWAVIEHWEKTLDRLLLLGQMLRPVGWRMRCFALGYIVSIVDASARYTERTLTSDMFDRGSKMKLCRVWSGVSVRQAGNSYKRLLLLNRSKGDGVQVTKLDMPCNHLQPPIAIAGRRPSPPKHASHNETNIRHSLSLVG